MMTGLNQGLPADIQNAITKNVNFSARNKIGREVSVTHPLFIC